MGGHRLDSEKTRRRNRAARWRFSDGGQLIRDTRDTMLLAVHASIPNGWLRPRANADRNPEILQTSLAQCVAVFSAVD